MYFDFLYKFLSETLLILRKTEGDLSSMYRVFI